MVLEQPGTPASSMQGVYNQLKTDKCFVLTAFRPEMQEMNSTVRGSEPHEVSSTMGTFVPHRDNERSEHNQNIHTSVTHKTTDPEEENGIVLDTEEVTALSAVREIYQETRQIQVPNMVDYLRPVNNDNTQHEIKSTDSSRTCDEISQTLPPSRPQPKPRVKTLGKRKREGDKLIHFKHHTRTETLTNMLESNPLYGKEATLHCASVKIADQSNQLIPQAKPRQHYGYQNELCTTTPYQSALRPAVSVESPYTRVLSNTNWEVSRDHLLLIDRIGGGSFGQVWRGAAFGVTGDEEWSVVAVKMLKGKERCVTHRMKLENLLCHITAILIYNFLLLVP